jgi:predicted ester cyclase
MTRMSILAGAAILAGIAAGDAGADDAFACTAESRQRNEDTVRIVFEEILGKGRIAENEHIYHPDFVARGMTRDATRAEDRAASEGWRSMAPDLQMKVLHLVSDCDHVAAHFEGSGTNTGEGNGFPATGRTIRVRGMTIFRLVDGRIIEEWSSFDQYALLKQLGLIQ